MSVIDDDTHATTDIGGPACSPPDPDDRADRISATFSRMFRLNVRMRSEFTAAQFDGRELPTLVLAQRLADDGPLRAGALAERLHMDPSQVSRAVAALVRERAVQRLADPDDGRATLLVLTPGGRELARRFARAKAAHFGSVVADWDPADAEAFTAGLERFVDGLETMIPSRTGQHGPSQTPAHLPDQNAAHLPDQNAARLPDQNAAHDPGPDGDDATDTTPAQPGATT